jgi:hypothetical protein
MTLDQAMQAQLDRLVVGELPENDRRSLLAWLDEDAGRWRACALAFLEAQTWEAATAGWPATMKAAPAPMSSLQNPASLSWQRLLTLAAAAAVLFFAGHWSARLWRPVAAPQREAPQSQGPLLASVPVRTNPSLPARLQIAVSPVADTAPPTPALSDYDRKQWEKRGFVVEEELRYLPAKLPDGRSVLVPVKKLQVKLKPNRVS